MEMKQQTETEIAKPRTLMQYLRILLTGVAMGAADIVPGVSGGTMAFILGIYEELVFAIRSFDLSAIRLVLALKFREFSDHVSLRFLITLGVGILISVLALSGVLTQILEDETGRIYLFSFFFGLVVASIIAIGAQVKWSMVAVLTLIAGAVVALIIVNLVPVDASHDPIVLFFSGMIAISAMILPGISGSFILLILGQYDYLLRAVSDRDLVPIVFAGAGAVVGILAFSRILTWFLKHYYNATITALTGFMIGSLWKIYPWKECVSSDLDRHGDFRCLQEANVAPDGDTILLAIVLFVLGFIIVSLLDHMQSRNNPILRIFWK